MATMVRERITVGDVARSFPENSPRVLIPQTVVQTKRLLVRWSRDPVTLIETLVLPIMFLLTLNIVLGQLISQTTGHSGLYGTVPMNALAAAINGSSIGAVGLIGERTNGLLRRLWVVPVHRASGVLSRILAEAVRILMTTLVVLGAGLLLGFRFTQGAPATLVWLAIPLIFGMAFATLITMVALYTAKNLPPRGSHAGAHPCGRLLHRLPAGGPVPALDSAGRRPSADELRDRGHARFVARRSGAHRR